MPPEALIAWGLALVALAVNVLQWLQGRALGRQISKQEKLLTQIAHREAPETAAAIGEQLQPEAFIQEAVAQQIAALPEREKLVVTLRYYEGLSSEEISEILGITPAHVDQIVHKALSVIRLSR